MPHIPTHTHVLIAKTRGDELVSPKEIPVLTGTREKLELERALRAGERAAWLARHPLPGWAMADVIVEEEIREIAVV